MEIDLNNKICSICLEIYKKETGLNNCPHTYCYNCIKQWSSHPFNPFEPYKKIYNTCCICRTYYSVLLIKHKDTRRKRKYNQDPISEPISILDKENFKIENNIAIQSINNAILILLNNDFNVNYFISNRFIIFAGTTVPANIPSHFIEYYTNILITNSKIIDEFKKEKVNLLSDEKSVAEIATTMYIHHESIRQRMQDILHSYLNINANEYKKQIDSIKINYLYNQILYNADTYEEKQIIEQKWIDDMCCNITVLDETEIIYLQNENINANPNNPILYNVITEIATEICTSYTKSIVNIFKQNISKIINSIQLFIDTDWRGCAPSNPSNNGDWKGHSPSRGTTPPINWIRFQNCNSTKQTYISTFMELQPFLQQRSSVLLHRVYFILLISILDIRFHKKQQQLSSKKTCRRKLQF